MRGEAAIGVALNAGFVGLLQEPDIDESNTRRGDMMSPYPFIGGWYLLHLKVLCIILIQSSSSSSSCKVNTGCAVSVSIPERGATICAGNILLGAVLSLMQH